MSYHANLDGVNLHNAKSRLYAGDPITGLVVPTIAGELIIDSTTDNLYRATGTGAGDWVLLSGGGTSGPASDLATAGASVNIGLSAAPTGSNKVLLTTDATHATWQSLPAGVASPFEYGVPSQSIVPVLGSNTTVGISSVIAGGSDNTISGAPGNGGNCVIGGGGLNTIGSGSAVSCTIAGGVQNVAYGQRATVGGGNSNQATNECATVPGGSENIASGQYSFAAGRKAQATHDGSFVLNDSIGGSAVASWAANTLTTRFTGGIKLVTTGGASGHVWIVDGTEGVSKALVSDANGMATWDSKPLAYDVSGQCVTTPASNQVLIKVVLARAVSLMSGVASFGKCNPAPSTGVTFSLRKNNIEFGQMIFASSATTATFTGSTTTVAGDVITVVSPVNLYGLADLTFVLAGSL